MIPVNEPLLNGNEKKYLIECIDTGWISSEGPFVKKFEDGLCSLVGVNYCTTVSNGTVALDIAFASLDLQEGDEVIVPSFTIISCIHELLRRRVNIKYIDLEDDTYNVSAESIISKINEKTKAILIVHIYGLTVDVQKVKNYIENKNIHIIEDCAQAIGQTIRDVPCGSIGDIAVMSFYPNKMITTGEGGAILTNCSTLHQFFESYKNLCFNPEKRFIHENIGTNARMTNLQAAIGVAQLERINSHIERKIHIGNLYLEAFKHNKELILPLKRTDLSENHFWVFPIRLANSRKSQELQHFLKKSGIGTRPFFYPLDHQPVLENYKFNISDKSVKSMEIYESGFYIPSGIALEDSQVHEVASVINGFLNA